MALPGGGNALSSMTTTELTKFIQEILRREVSKQFIVLQADQIEAHDALILAKGSTVTDGNFFVHVVGATGEPALTNAWVQVTSQPARFYKDAFGIVRMAGALQSGTIAQTMFTLPPGYRPPYQLIFPVRAGGSTVGTVIVNTDGTIKHETGTNTLICLDNITYKAS